MSDADTPQGDDNTNNKERETQQANTEIKGAANLQKNTHPYNCAQEPQKHPPSSKWFHRIDWSQVVLDGLLLIIGIRLACIYSGQLEQMIESNKISRESLESVQRAFVVFSNFSPQRIRDRTGTYMWEVPPQFENSGNTPAIRAVSIPSAATSDTGGIPEELFRNGNGGNSVLTRDTIAPKATLIPTMGPITESDIFGSDIGSHYEKFLGRDHQVTNLYFFGWVVYNDVLPHTGPHLTEYCKLMGQHALIPTNPPQIQWNFTTCRKHNCTDEYCPDYAEIVEYAEARAQN
jgi:hypothetical protein